MGCAVWPLPFVFGQFGTSPKWPWDTSAPVKIWCRSVRTLRHQLFGAEVSWCRTVLVPKCPDTINNLYRGRRAVPLQTITTRHIVIVNKRQTEWQTDDGPNGDSIGLQRTWRLPVNSSQPCGQLVTRCVKLKGQLVTCDELVMWRVDWQPPQTLSLLRVTFVIYLFIYY